MSGGRPAIVSFYTRGTPYEADAAKLRRTATAFGYDARITPIVPRDSWESNCSAKARLCLDALRETERPCLFLDADCWLDGHLAPLDDPPFDLAVTLCPLEKMGLGTYAIRYRRWASHFGGMWNSGVVYMRPTPNVMAVMERWVDLCEADPRTWDQIHLRRAWQQAGTGLGAAELPASCQIGGLIGHSSAHHRHWAADVQRWLVLGSAPYVPEWWDEHGERFVQAGFLVAAINHAWKIPGKALASWLRPNDFHDEEPPETWLHDNASGWRIRPRWCKDGRTTLVDALHHLMNGFLVRNSKVEVHVVGSDYIYPPGATHFYGAGTADPLRHGQTWLETALNRTLATFNSEGCPLYNAGGQAETLLPFPRSPMTEAAA